MRNVQLKKISQEDVIEALNQCVIFMADENIAEDGQQIAPFKAMFDNHVVAIKNENGFSTIYFKDLDLSNLDLSHKDILTWIEFNNVDLNGAKLTNSTLEWVVFDKCDMRSMDLSNTKIREGGGFYHSNLENALLQNFVKQNAWFFECNMQKTNFTGAKITGWGDIEKCDFTNAVFNGVMIDGHGIDGLEFKNSIFKGAVLDNVAIAGEVVFSNTCLAEAVFESIILKNTIQMNGADVGQDEMDLLVRHRKEWLEKGDSYVLSHENKIENICDRSGQKEISQEDLNVLLTECMRFMTDENHAANYASPFCSTVGESAIAVMNDVGYMEIHIKDLNLNGLDLSCQGNLSGISFENVCLTKAQMVGTDLEMVFFQNCDMREMNFSETYFTHIFISDSNLENIDFRDVEIQYAGLYGNNMSTANFTDAKINMLLEIRDCNLSNALFKDVLATGDMEIRNSILKNAVFENVDIQGNAYFVNSPMTEAILKNIKISNFIELNGIRVGQSQFDYLNGHREEWLNREDVACLYKNGFTDVAVAKELLQGKGMDKVEVTLLIRDLSPNLPGRSDEIRVFVKDVMKQAEKEMKVLKDSEVKISR